MIYLLDTDALIVMIRGLKPGRPSGKRRVAERLVERARQTQASGDSVGLSSITISELEFGDRNSAKYEEEIAAVQKVLTPFDLYDYESIACPPHYGRIRFDLESQGVPIGSMDLLIAAHALALGATLVSNNLAHFGRIKELKTINWIAAGS